MNPDPLLFFRGEAGEREIVQLDEAVQQLARGIELDREPAFREIDLHVVRSFRQAGAHFLLVLAQKVVDKFFPGISRNAFRRIHQSERGGRDNGLFDGPIGQALCVFQKLVGPAAIAKRAFR